MKRGQVCGALKDSSASFIDPIPIWSSTWHWFRDIPDYCTGLPTDLASWLKAKAAAATGVYLSKNRKKRAQLSTPGVTKVVLVRKCLNNQYINNVGFDSFFSSESFVKCSFIHPSSNVSDCQQISCSSLVHIKCYK